MKTEVCMVSFKDQSVAVPTTVGPTIRLHSGALFDFLNPEASKFTIEDIAHGLSNICRYAGQCSRFYSVAEHSVYVSETAKGFEYPALMHDAAEAFLGDVSGPLKRLVPEFKKIEIEIERVIFSRFGLEWPPPAEVTQTLLERLIAHWFLIPDHGVRQSGPGNLD
jgi:uncharacterized protein